MKISDMIFEPETDESKRWGRKFKRSVRYGAISFTFIFVYLIYKYIAPALITPETSPLKAMLIMGPLILVCLCGYLVFCSGTNWVQNGD